MDNQKQQILERIKQANNILVTVSANPSVDQLASCLGLTIMLNELGKHATAVFSGNVPSIIEFLQPEKTLEKNTDSLRDFIIALDKAKADKLRYKVEDTVVKIFITPYRTSISDKDLEFSQGDFNVEVVIALGVHDQKDLDQAITTHGRILHDATVMSINTTAGNNLGTINWQDSKASSLSEMVTNLAENFDKKVFDNQVATALLTGIVAETDRFSNSKTSPDTMKASASLMAAGANQQLVATKLQEPAPAVVVPKVEEPAAPIPAPSGGMPMPGAGTPFGQPPVAQPPEPPKPQDGTLQIEHNPADEEKEREQPEDTWLAKPEEPKNTTVAPQIHIDDQGEVHRFNDDRGPLSNPGPNSSGSTSTESRIGDDAHALNEPIVTESSNFVFSPPALGGKLTANSSPEEETESASDSLRPSETNQPPILSHNDGPTVAGFNSNNMSSSFAGTALEEDHKDMGLSGAMTPVIQSTPSAAAANDIGTLPSMTLPEPQLGPAPATPAPVISPLYTPAEPSTLPTMPTPAGDNSASTQTGPVMPAPITPSEPASTSNIAMPAVADSTGDYSPAVNSARDAVMSAIDLGGDSAPSPIAALNAQPLGGPLHEEQNGGAAQQDTFSGGRFPVIQPLGNPNFNEAAPDAASPSAQPLDMPLPPTLMPPPAVTTPPTSSQTHDPSAPPPVPPPMMPLL